MSRKAFCSVLVARVVKLIPADCRRDVTKCWGRGGQVWLTCERPINVPSREEVAMLSTAIFKRYQKRVKYMGQLGQSHVKGIQSLFSF